VLGGNGKTKYAKYADDREALNQNSGRVRNDGS
jgi:hypothetical protein